MATLTPQAIARTGLAPVYTAVNSSDAFPNDGKTFLHVKNTNAATRVITVTSKAVATTGLIDSDLTYTIAATTGDVMIGPFPPGAYNDSTTGLVTVGYSATTNVTAAVIQLPS